jgi:chromosome segregation ATPase
MPERRRPRLTGRAQLSRETVDQLSRAMEQAWRRIKGAESRLWGEWIVVGEGLLAGRRWALQVSGSEEPRGRAYNTAYSEWLNHYRGIRDMHETVRARLLKVMEERPAIEEWRATLTEPERRNLNNPTTVWRKFNARTRTPASRRQRNASRTGEELDQSNARIDELEEELQQVRQENTELDEELRQARHELVEELEQQAQAREQAQEHELTIDQLVDALIARIEQGVNPQLRAGVLRLLASFNQARRRSRQRQVSDAVH